jgi:carbamoyl-phosphate synthase/aspartate carbamoyltransferase/dihydroorotase
LGATATNAASLAQIADHACGLKMYLDATHGPLHLEGIASLPAHLKRWPKGKPLAVHAEGRSLALMLLLAVLYERPIHVCHVSRADEIHLIRKTKEWGLPITCEVTPHHLLFCEEDFSHLDEGERAVKPPLGSPADRLALWDHFDIIDCIATDHAPHIRQEKQGSSAVPGFPGLETSLTLIHGAVRDGRMTMEDLIARTYVNPRRIFSIPEQLETFVEFDPDAVWDVNATDLKSRCGWTPYEGMRLRGRVRRVTLRGKLAYDDGKVLAAPGNGNDLYMSS